MKQKALKALPKEPDISNPRLVGTEMLESVDTTEALRIILAKYIPSKKEIKLSTPQNWEQELMRLY